MSKKSFILKTFLSKTLLLIMAGELLFGLSALPVPEILKAKTAYAESSPCSSGSGQANFSPRVGGVSLDQAAKFLADMSDITGAYYDSVKDRIVFIGKQNVSAPQFDKDDLAVAIRALFFNNSIPSVSIEFKDLSNIMSDPNMNVLFYGGIENTHFGKALLDADYRLKMFMGGYDQNGQQIVTSVPTYISVLQRFLAYGPDPTKVSASRWWISPKEVLVKRDNTTKSFAFDTVSMQVQTAPLISNNDPAWDQAAIDFAQEQTANYDAYAAETPTYFEVKQLSKIVAIVKWLKDNNIPSDFQWARDYQPALVPTPQEIPRLTTPQFPSNGYLWSMTGGVTFDTPSTYSADDGTAAGLKSSSEAVNAPKEDNQWQFTNNGQQYQAVAVAASAFRSLGGYSTSVTDFSIPAVGDNNLSLNRTYSSFSGAQNGIGLGWEMLPARMMNIKPGWNYSSTSCPQPPTSYVGPYPWKLAFQLQSGDYESFTFACNWIYVADKPEYNSKLLRNLDGGYTVRLPNQTEYVFDINLRLTQVKDKTGTALSYSYDTSGRLSGITDANAHALSFSYNPQNLVANISDWTGRQVQYTYDSKGNLVSVTDPKAGATNYVYDANNKLSQIKNRLGQTVLQNTYGPEAKLTSQTGAGGLTSNYTYDEANKTIFINDSTGRTGRVVYDDKARVLQDVDALGGVTTYTYGTEYAPLSVADKRGNQVNYVYDVAGNITLMTLPTGKSVAFTYDAKNNLTKITDNRYGGTAKITQFVYDASGNLTQSNEAGVATNYTYDAYGQMLTLSNQLNQNSSYAYDNFGNIVTTTDPLGQVFSRQYDLLGRLVQQTDANGKTVSFSYDANNNLLSQTDASGAAVYEYDAENRLKKEILPTGAVTEYSYNPANSLTSVNDALANTTAYAYDGHQNLVSQQDALLKTTQFAYDAKDRRTGEITALGRATNWQYDANGNITRRTDAKGNITNYVYDALNRLILITYPDGKQASFSYDDRGNVITLTDAVGVATYTYDSFDRLTQTTNPYGQGLAYSHDQIGNLKTLTYPGSKLVTYNYDARNALANVIDWNGQQTSYTYNANGKLASAILPNGVSAIYGYNGANQLISLEYKKAGISFAKFTYTRDTIGNVTQVTEAGSAFLTASSSTSSFVYDQLGRLIQASYPGAGSIGYSFDKVGNRTTLNQNASTTNYYYNADHQLINTNVKVYDYDSNGNITSVKIPPPPTSTPTSLLNIPLTPAVSSVPSKPSLLSQVSSGAAHAVKSSVSFVASQFLPKTASAAAKPSITSFTATPSTITAGGSTTLAWTVSGNKITSLTINQGVGSVLGLTSKSVSPATTTTYTLTAKNSAGTASKSVTVTVNPLPPVINSFTAAPASITAGQSSTLSWTLAGGAPTTLSINQGIGSVLGTSSKSVTPATTTTYTLTASNLSGTVTKQVTVTVAPLPAPIINSFTASSSVITIGQSSTLSWTLSGGSASSLTIDQGIGSVIGLTSKSVSPATTTTYTLTATNASGSVNRQVTITVNPLPPVINSFTASSSTITLGQSSTLSWTLSGGAPSSLTINNGVGSVIGLSSKQVFPATTTIYTLTATNAGGTANKTVTVTVSPGAPIINSFIATPVTITNGSSTTLSWTLSGGAPTQLSINQGVGSVLGLSSKTVSPSTTTTYSLQAINSMGGYIKNVTVTVIQQAPVINSFTASSTSITAGQSSTLSWSLSGGAPTTLSINQGIGSVLGLTSKSVSPATTTTYTLTASNSAGTVSRAVTVTVSPLAPSISTFVATPTIVITGSSTILSWTLSGGAPTTLTIDQGVGSVLGLTSKSVTLATSTTYTLTATNASGSVTKQATVTVNPPSSDLNYVWDYENRLIQLSTASEITTYTYDAAGNRLQKTRNGVATRYLNDSSGGLSRVLAESDASNTIQSYYLYGLGLISSGSAASSTRSYLLSDGLGNTRFITDANGNITKKYDYDPYGNIRLSSGSALNNYQFQTEQTDPESGLYFLRARYYDPSTGRFISKDPVKGILSNPQTQNPYVYANNNPVNLSDPSGKFWDLIDAGFFALSLKQFADCPSWSNAGWAALDAVSLLPIIPSVGYITHADDAVKAGKALSSWPSAFGGRQVINGIEYTTHALEKMEPVGLGGRGIPPSVIENAIQYGTKTLGNEPGTIVSTYENVTVVTNDALNRVITVIKTGY